MTLQERLAASIAKSRTGSPKIVTPTEEGAGEADIRTSGELTGEANGVVKENGPFEPVRTDTPDVPVSPVRTEIPAVQDSWEIPSGTETPDLQAIPGDNEAIEPPPSQPPTEIITKPPIQPESSTPDISISILPPSAPEITTPNGPSPTRTSSARPSTSQPPISLSSDTDPATVDLITQLRSDLATCESRRIEEAQQSALRITSLEEKLKLLTEITQARSKEEANDPSVGTWERKLADREEKIALLLDEGASYSPPFAIYGAVKMASNVGRGTNL